MGLTCGIVGLPNVGKSTIFNALTRAGAAVANYPFCTIDPNVGVVEVPDERLVQLEKLMKPSKVTPTTVQFLDIAGLVKGASKGEGLGNQFLGHIRQVDAIVHVVRCFTDDDIVLSSGQTLDSKESIEIINTELLLADLQTLEKRINKQQKVAKSGDEKARHDLAVCTKIQDALSNGIPAIRIPLAEDEAAVLAELELLSAKPVLYAINCSDTPDYEELQHIKIVEQIAAEQGSEVVKINGKLEAELNELDAAEREEFLKELGIKESGLNHLIRVSYKLLCLMTFFTGATNRELRAWTIHQGTKLPKAAGCIHTDLEKGFIRGEVIHYEDFIKVGSEVAIKEKGLLHVEGKEYIVQDGDILNIRFNV